MQANRLLTFGLILVMSFSAHAEKPDRKQLARECDELIAQAIRRPYGWAFADAGPDGKSHGGGQAVNLEPPGTAAAGFVLYWAGDLLDQPKYKEATYQVARGIVAAQRATGQIPARPIFLPGAAGGRDEPILVADRAPTRAALALLLSMLDDAGGKDELLKRGSSRAITWLLKQQSTVGAWPLGYPPTTAPKDASRLTRLDLPDYRDSVFTMLLAHDVLQDVQHRKSVERSLEALLRMRVSGASKVGAPLWATAYGLDVFPTDRIAEYPPGVDVLASRNAMQTLLAAYLMLGDPPIKGKPEERITWSQPLFAAADAAADLPKYDGKWIRTYDYDVAATPAPKPPIAGGFVADVPDVPPSLRTGTWGIDSALAAVSSLRAEAREKYLQHLSSTLPMRQRLAATILGLTDDPFPPDPSSEAAFASDGAAPTDLAPRVRRLWRLVLRARLAE